MPTGKDVLHALTKGGLGAIPIAGSAISELFSLVIASPLEKRRERWMQEVGERLIKLETENRINFENLKENDQFIDAVLYSTALAVKTSERKKIQAFQNIVINTALGLAPGETLTHIFLNFLDNFSETHIAILNLFDDPQKWFFKNLNIDTEKEKIFQDWCSLGEVVNKAIPEYGGKDHIIDLVWNDLFNAQLVDSKSLRTSQTADGALSTHTSILGKEFIRYITAQEILN